MLETLKIAKIATVAPSSKAASTVPHLLMTGVSHQYLESSKLAVLGQPSLQVKLDIEQPGFDPSLKYLEHPMMQWNRYRFHSLICHPQA